MSAASANRDARRSVGEVQNYLGHSGYHVYAGTLVMGTSAGYVRPFAEGDTQSYFAGVAMDEIDCSSSNSDITVADGAEEGRVYKTGTFTLAATGTASQNHVGKVAYAHDDQTVGTSSTQAQGVGVIQDAPTSSTYRVRIDDYVDTMKGASGWHTWQYQGSPSTP